MRAAAAAGRAVRAGGARDAAGARWRASGARRGVRRAARAQQLEEQGQDARERRVETIKASAPFVDDAACWARSVAFETVLGGDYGGEAPADARDVPGGSRFLQRLSGDRARAAALAPRERLKAAGGQFKVVSTFMPEPTKLLVRWTYTEKGDDAAVVEGSTTYRLTRDGGAIDNVEHTWQVRREGLGEMDVFNVALRQARHQRPPDASVFAWFAPAVRLAAWEALMEDPDFGGQLVRSELDDLTDQAIIAFVALMLSFVLLFGKVGYLLVTARGG